MKRVLMAVFDVLGSVAIVWAVLWTFSGFAYK